MKKLLLLLVLFFLIVSPVFARTQSKEVNPDLQAEIVYPDTFTAGSEIEFGLEIKDKNTKEPVAGLDINVKINDSAGNKIFEDKAEPGQKVNNEAVYSFGYSFAKGGNYQIQSEFKYKQKDQKFSFNIFVAEPVKESFWNTTTKTGGIIFGLLVAAVFIWGISKRKFKLMLIWLVIIALVGYGAYAVYVTKMTGAKAIISCNSDGTCYLLGHWHSLYVMKVCGEDKHLPVNKGPLSQVHTHQTEKDVIHWHDKLPYDKAAQKPLDLKPLTLGAVFDNMEIPFNKDKIFDKKNGDVCPGESKPGSLKLLVNGQPNTEYRDYVWKDRNIIYIVFDSRSAEEVQKEYQAHPAQFPGSGQE